MQLKTKDGIMCDECGTTYQNDFTYYSFDYRPTNVLNNIKPSLDIILSIPIIFSLDICTACFDKHKNAIISNYASIMSPKHTPRTNIICELTGKKLIGDYLFYYCQIAKVDVKITGQPSICTKCKTVTHDITKICVKCNSVNFVRPAHISADRRFLEINICEEAFKQMVAKSELIIKVAGEWATKS